MEIIFKIKIAEKDIPNMAKRERKTVAEYKEDSRKQMEDMRKEFETMEKERGNKVVCTLEIIDGD